MPRFEETEISKAILDAYHRKLSDRIVGDVIIAGAGPSGLVAAYDLARAGVKATVLEKKLAPGGGVWGGGMGMNEAVVQVDALAILDEFGVRHAPCRDGLHTVDTVELAAALTVKAIQAGAVVLNLVTVEDVCVRGQRVAGVVANRTMISGVLHVDPITLSARAVIDGTGHEAVVVETLRRRGLLAEGPAAHGIEGPMDAAAGEDFVVDNVAEVYPGLWVCGMSVSAVLGGPRMGPIFGGMLMSGRRVAEMVAASLA